MPNKSPASIEPLQFAIHERPLLNAVFRKGPWVARGAPHVYFIRVEMTQEVFAQSTRQPELRWQEDPAPTGRRWRRNRKPGPVSGPACPLVAGPRPVCGAWSSRRGQSEGHMGGNK